MNDLEKILNSAKKVSGEIEDLLQQAKYNDYDDLSGLNINHDDVEQLFILNELRDIMEKLDEARDKIDYLNCPVKHIGTLKKNSRGRYETKFREYTSGSGIEVSIYDDYDERDRWIKTSVEHDGKDYYLVGCKNIKMQGLKVRIRGLT